jgi:hypothetical protein
MGRWLAAILGMGLILLLGVAPASAADTAGALSQSAQCTLTGNGVSTEVHNAGGTLSFVVRSGATCQTDVRWQAADGYRVVADVTVSPGLFTTEIVGNGAWQQPLCLGCTLKVTATPTMITTTTTAKPVTTTTTAKPVTTTTARATTTTTARATTTTTTARATTTTTTAKPDKKDVTTTTTAAPTSSTVAPTPTATTAVARTVTPPAPLPAPSSAGSTTTGPAPASSMPAPVKQLPTSTAAPTTSASPATTAGITTGAMSNQLTTTPSGIVVPGPSPAMVAASGDPAEASMTGAITGPGAKHPSAPRQWSQVIWLTAAGLGVVAVLLAIYVVANADGSGHYLD